MLNLKKAALNFSSKIGLLNTQRSLVLAVSEENQVYETFLKLSIDRINASTSLLRWGKKENNEALKDSICRMYDINLMWASVQRELAEETKCFSVALKEILQVEAGLDALRKHLKDITDKKERLSKFSDGIRKKLERTASSANEIAKLEAEASEIRSELEAKSLKAELFKNTVVRSSLLNVVDAHLKYTKKTELVFNTLKQLVENMPEVPLHLKETNNPLSEKNSEDYVKELAKELQMESRLSSADIASPQFCVDVPDKTKHTTGGFLIIEKPKAPPRTVSKNLDRSEQQFQDFVMITADSSPEMAFRKWAQTDSQLSFAQHRRKTNDNNDSDSDDYIEPIDSHVENLFINNNKRNDNANSEYEPPEFNAYLFDEVIYDEPHIDVQSENENVASDKKTQSKFFVELPTKELKPQSPNEYLYAYDHCANKPPTSDGVYSIPYDDVNYQSDKKTQNVDSPEEFEGPGRKPQRNPKPRPRKLTRPVSLDTSKLPPPKVSPVAKSPVHKIVEQLKSDSDAHVSSPGQHIPTDQKPAVEPSNSHAKKPLLPPAHLQRNLSQRIQSAKNSQRYDNCVISAPKESADSNVPSDYGVPEVHTVITNTPSNFSRSDTLSSKSILKQSFSEYDNLSKLRPLEPIEYVDPNDLPMNLIVQKPPVSPQENNTLSDFKPLSSVLRQSSSVRGPKPTPRKKTTDQLTKEKLQPVTSIPTLTQAKLDDNESEYQNAF